MTTHYDISISPETGEYKVLLRGPGIEGNGKPYVFRNMERCETFVDAINFTYWQGLRDGLRREDRGGEFFVVSGTTPDNMVIRRESWLRRVKRRIRRRLCF